MALSVVVSLLLQKMVNVLLRSVKNSPEFSEQCDIAYQEALARAERNAPRYNNEFECENDFYEDDCYYSSSSRAYVPHFGGFFYSRALSGLKGYNKSYYSEPMYRYKSKFYNGAGQFFGSYRNQPTKVATSNLNKRGRLRNLNG